jgi:serine/threonine protein kinase
LISGSTDKKLYQRISDNEVSFPDEVSKETREIIELMMSKDPDDRPTAVDVLRV